MAKNIVLVSLALFQAMLTYMRYRNVHFVYSSVVRALNKTADANQTFMIFNQVPKTGSENMIHLIDSLSFKNNFMNISSNPEFNQKYGYFHYFDEDLKRYYINMLLFPEIESHQKIAYDKHMNFLNFEEFNRTNPIYVSMVRNPVERIISWYYYQRQTWYLTEMGHESDPTFYKETFEDCIWNEKEYCQFIPGNSIFTPSGIDTQMSQLSYYCGHGHECTLFGNADALKLAKSNVEKYYAVVGVLESMEETLRVLEQFVPDFFDGAVKVYRASPRKKTNENKQKPPVSWAIKQLLAKNMTHEIDFYEFCRQRLYKQYLSLPINHNYDTLTLQ